MTPKPARFVTVLALPLVLLVFATPARSQEEHPTFAKVGAYVGVSGLLDFTLDGLSFDGTSYYKQVDGEEILILPHLEQTNMIRTVVGFRAARGAFEMSYEQTHHAGTFLDMPGEATFHSINADERIFVLINKRFQPYVLIGGSIPWLTIKDGSFLDPDVGNATFKGFGVNTEAGITIYPHPRVGLSTGYRYRAMWFDRATGVSDTYYRLRPRFRETNGSVTMTAFFTF